MGLENFFRQQERFPSRQFPSDKDLGWENRRVLATRQPHEKKATGGRGWVLGLLLGSILASLGFWFWGSFSSSKENFLTGLVRRVPTPALATPTPTPTPRNTTEITKEVSGMVSGLQGDYGLYVFNLTTKYSYGLLESETFIAASLMKLPVILALYKEVERGVLSLDSTHVLAQADKRSGAGSMQYKPAGTTFTYGQMVKLMGQQSDNTAFVVFRKILGDENIQTVIDNLGMVGTSVAKNETTPADIGLFFRKLYGSNIVTREHRDEILSFLTKTAFEDRIPAGVPADVRVAHKIGSEVGVFSDAGIVFTDRPFVLVIMSKNAKELEAKTALPEITKAVWEFETE